LSTSSTFTIARTFTTAPKGELAATSPGSAPSQQGTTCVISGSW
jgi:hypothetical protein